MDDNGRTHRYERYQQAVEVPLRVLALLLIPLLTVPLVVEILNATGRGRGPRDVVVMPHVRPRPMR